MSTSTSDDLEREWAFFRDLFDPLVRELLTLDDPWDPYRCALKLPVLLMDTSPGGSFGLFHAGEVLSAWSVLADLYDTGRTPIAEAHSTLRSAASVWLARPAAPTPGFVESWLTTASDSAEALFRRDGDWWNDPE